MDLDFLLVQKMKAGDEDALEKFVRKYYPAILRYCHMHTADAGYAEDLTQETFEHFFRNLGDYQHLGKTANYLYRIAGNLCRDHYRKKTDIAMEELPEQEENSAELVEKQLDMESALRKLPEEFREIVILYYFQDLKLKEIADVLDIGLPLVKYRMKKAKEQLGRILGEEDWV